MTKLTSSQYKDMIAANSKKTAKISKYRSIPTTVGGIRFHSKKEAQYYERLKAEKEQRGIKYILTQVPFRLPAGIKYFLDFMIVYYPSMRRDENIEYVDVKGYMTKEAKIKIKQTQEIYGIEIKLV